MTTHPSESRAAYRKTTYSGAEIIPGGNKEKIGCIVRDLSTRGARIEVRLKAGPVPDRFQLNIPNVLKQNCRVVWRKDREIGVSFT
jgi:hypothetical protein